MTVNQLFYQLLGCCCWCCCLSCVHHRQSIMLMPMIMLMLTLIPPPSPPTPAAWYAGWSACMAAPRAASCCSPGALIGAKRCDERARRFVSKGPLLPLSTCAAAPLQAWPYSSSSSSSSSTAISSTAAILESTPSINIFFYESEPKCAA